MTMGLYALFSIRLVSLRKASALSAPLIGVNASQRLVVRLTVATVLPFHSVKYDRSRRFREQQGK
jgi:hypothetical protein